MSQVDARNFSCPDSQTSGLLLGGTPRINGMRAAPPPRRGPHAGNAWKRETLPPHQWPPESNSLKNVTEVKRASFSRPRRTGEGAVTIGEMGRVRGGSAPLAPSSFGT